MSKHISVADQPELSSLRELSALVGSDLLLTQASTGNSSIKLENILWIKTSGKWMADAIHEDIFIPLDLREVKECVKQKADPAELDVRASIETAMHAVMPHRVVLHIHSVDTIAWAVRQDAPVQLKYRLDGLLWQWISYVTSYWATTVWSSAEMIAALSKSSCPKCNNVSPYVRGSQTRPTMLR